MTEKRKKALALVGVGAAVLLFTSPAAALLKGIPALLWNAIYPVGVIVGLSCLLIGLVRLVRSANVE